MTVRQPILNKKTQKLKKNLNSKENFLSLFANNENKWNHDSVFADCMCSFGLFVVWLNWCQQTLFFPCLTHSNCLSCYRYVKFLP